LPTETVGGRVTVPGVLIALMEALNPFCKSSEIGMIPTARDHSAEDGAPRRRGRRRGAAAAIVPEPIE
jgi:hypothetical protein